MSSFVNHTIFDQYVPDWLMRSRNVFCTIVDENGNYIYANQYFKDVFSCNWPTWIKNGYTNSVHPDDLDVLNCAVSRLLAFGGIEKFEIRKPTSLSGDYIHTQWEISQIKNEFGKVFAFLNIGFDLTNEILYLNSLRETEFKLQAIFNSTNHPTILLNKDFTIQYINKAAEELGWQMVNAKPLINDNILSYLSLSFIDFFKELIDKAWDGLCTETEYFIEDKWWSLKVFSVLTDSKKRIGVALQVIDITIDKEKENRILEQNQRLRQIAWQQSHEVRAPLSNMLGLLHLMQLKSKETNGEELDFLIQSLIGEGNKLDKVIHEIVKNSNHVFDRINDKEVQQ